MVDFKYKHFFPHTSIRKEQDEAIKFCLNSFINSNKRFVVIEAGTGVGKSAVGLTVARYINSKCKPQNTDTCSGSYFVTTQKILQQQYTKDFGPPKGRMCSIKSSSNYKCKFHKKNNCKESQQILRTADRESSFFKACSFRCVYKEAKQSFLESTESVTNFPYFLTEATFSGKISTRKFLVVDEAHNVESELSKFIEIIVSERFAKSILKLTWPKKATQYQVFKWIKDVYYPKAKSQLSHFEKMLKQVGIKDRIKEFVSVAKQHDMLTGHVEKIGTFLKVYSSDNWVMEKVKGEGRSMRKFSFRAIDISPFAQRYLFRLGEKVLMMSATILDHKVFAKSLGIPENEIDFISIPSPFPLENRPILIHPVGNMSARAIDASLPKIVKAVREILKHHKGEKGIIHCHTYRIANYLKRNLRSKRLLFHNSENRDETLSKHVASKSDTVIVSPSMSEGVDLKQDLSRFQIILKIPYPYLGDQLIRKRMNKWSGWYPLQTAKKLVQAAGRSVRSKDDKAITYILDADWERFYRKNSGLFSADFRNAIVK